MTQIILDNLESIAVLLGVAFMSYNNYRSSKSDTAGEVISNYAVLEKQLKDQKEELEKKLANQAASHSDEMNKLHRILGEKDSTIQTQQAVIEQYKATIENRNPDLEKILKDISEYMKSNNELMQAIRQDIAESKEISSSNSEELHEQTSMLKDGKKVMLVGELVPAPHDEIPTP